MKLIVQSEPVSPGPSEQRIFEKLPQDEVSEPSPTVSSVDTSVTNGDNHSSSGQCSSSGDVSPPLSRSIPTPVPPAFTLSTKTVTAGTENDDSRSCHFRYRTTTKVLYNGSLYDSVEQVVADIETHPGLWRTDAAVTGQSNGISGDGDMIGTPASSSQSSTVTNELGADEQRGALCDTDSVLGRPSAKSAPIVFRPVHRERKVSTANEYNLIPGPNTLISIIVLVERLAQEWSPIDSRDQGSFVFVQQNFGMVIPRIVHVFAKSTVNCC